MGEELIPLGCPFCGKAAFIEVMNVKLGSNKTGLKPNEYAILYETKPLMFDKKIYYWKRDGYRIRCSDKKCIGRNLYRNFNTREEAIREWNKRK